MAIMPNETDELTERRLKKWLETLEDPDVSAAANAAEKLGKLGHTGAVQPLVKAMKTRSELVAAAAARALGDLHDRSAVAALIDVAKNHDEAIVRTAAIQSLGMIGDARAVIPLSQILDDYLSGRANDRLSKIRGYNYALLTSTVTALQQIGTPQALRAAAKAREI